MTDQSLVPAAVSSATVQSLIERHQIIERIIASVLVEGVDYGKVPGIPRPFLYDAGATVLALAFGLRIDVQPIQLITDWTGKDHGQPFFYAYYRATAYSPDGTMLGAAEASCNSMEPGFRYREMLRLCPHCNQPAITRGKKEFGGGYVCLRKAGGCGAKFDDNDPAIVNQQVGRVENPDIAGDWHNIMARAQKRARVAVIRNATGAGRYFSQDPDLAIAHASLPEEDNAKPAENTPTVPTTKTAPIQPAPITTTPSAPRSTTEVIAWLSDAMQQVRDGEAMPSPSDLKTLTSILATMFPDRNVSARFTAILLKWLGLEKMNRAFVVALSRWATANKAVAMAEAARIVGEAEGPGGNSNEEEG